MVSDLTSSKTGPETPGHSPSRSATFSTIARLPIRSDGFCETGVALAAPEDDVIPSGQSPPSWVAGCSSPLVDPPKVPPAATFKNQKIFALKWPCIPWQEGSFGGHSEKTAILGHLTKTA